MRCASSVNALSSVPAKLLLCDEDRAHTDELARGLDQLGHTVEVVCSHAEAFAIACAYDLDALVVAPFLRDGSALILPSALGIRRPPLVLLICALSERLAPRVVTRLGFDAQLTKVVAAEDVDRRLARTLRRDTLVVGAKHDAAKHDANGDLHGDAGR